jgi:hypothetical protein
VPWKKSQGNLQTACKHIGSLAARCPRVRETGARITQATEDK